MKDPGSKTALLNILCNIKKITINFLYQCHFMKKNHIHFVWLIKSKASYQKIIETHRYYP